MKKFRLILFTILMSNALFAQKFVPIETESKIKFTIKNFGLTVDGSFSGVKGNVLYDIKNVEKSEISLSLNSESVNTNNKERDKHLKKEDYFDVEKFPKILFVSTKITKKEGLNKYQITGNLTIKGTTKSVQFESIITNNNSKVTLKGALEINRRNFKVGSNSLVLSDNVKLNFIVVNTIDQ